MIPRGRLNATEQLAWRRDQRVSHL